MPHTKEQRRQHYLAHRERFLQQARDQRAKPDYKQKSAQWEEKRRATPERKAYAAEYNRIYYRRKRDEALAAYGGVCKQCGETDKAVLQFDHVLGDGEVHRKALKARNGLTLFRVLKKEGWPLYMQVLCHTCHVAKTKAER